MLNKFCCEALQRYVEDEQMIYDPITRSVEFYINDKVWSGHDDFSAKAICCYCPFCGTKLPKSLYGVDENGNHIYADALEEEVGKEYCDITEDEIPEEFKSDEWWKKRGL